MDQNSIRSLSHRTLELSSESVTFISPVSSDFWSCQSFTQDVLTFNS